MLTIDGLREYGADVEDGLSRCMNMEDFYLQLVDRVLGDGYFETLDAAIESGDNTAIFEAAHALKGALGNLGLTPVLRPVSEITELYRHADGPVDSSAIVDVYRAEAEKLRGLKG